MKVFVNDETSPTKDITTLTKENYSNSKKRQETIRLQQRMKILRIKSARL